ncbi:Methyltransferase domain-containing protein [Plasmodiophora brassicae]
MTDGVLEWDDDLSSAYRSAMRQAAADGLPLGRLFDPALGDADRDRVFRWYQRCHEAIRLPMAHAVPSRQAVFVIAQFSPVIEIGAGTGYWARLIRQRTGADIVAFDRVARPPDVLACDDLAAVLQEHTGRTLFLCWPDLSDMGSVALQAYTGDIVLYIGESFGRTLHGDFSQTGNAAFHLGLVSRFHEILRLPLPNWPGNRDCLSVFKRTETLTMSVGDPPSIETFQHVPPDERIDLAASSPAGERILQQAAAMRPCARRASCHRTHT